MWGGKRTPGRLGPIMKPVFRRESSQTEAVVAAKWQERQTCPWRRKGEFMEAGGVRCDLVGLRRAPGWKDPKAIGM